MVSGESSLYDPQSTSQVVWNRRVSPVKIGPYVARELAQNTTLSAMDKYLRRSREFVQPSKKAIRHVQVDFSPEFGHGPVAFCLNSGIVWVYQHGDLYEDMPRDQVIPVGTWVVTSAPVKA